MCTQVAHQTANDGEYRVFPFPSNGKAHVHAGTEESSPVVETVSIPFKRESTCAPRLTPAQTC